jgi:hypothetical protein
MRTQALGREAIRRGYLAGAITVISSSATSEKSSDFPFWRLRDFGPGFREFEGLLSRCLGFM